MDIDAFRIVNESIIDSIVAFFGLPDAETDTYRYTTESSVVTLAQAKEVLASGKNTYRYYHGSEVVAVPAADVEAYVGLFRPSTQLVKAGTSFLANAKKSSPRESAARYLTSRLLCPVSLARRKEHANPYFELWALACKTLGFVGPLDNPAYANVAAARQAHPILPIFMHHFGCAVPSFDALTVIAHYCKKRRLVELGSGNGYWTAMLRRQGVEVTPVDDGSANWRTETWVRDTVRQDACAYLRKNREEMRNSALLLVYPIVGGDGLTGRMIDLYTGDIVFYVGTQNANRYTGFSDRTVEAYMASTGNWDLTVRLPIPSFPGKDDALYVFERRTK